MSFRLFVYYCALCGGWAAFLAWLLGRALAPRGDAVFLRAVMQGLTLGLLVAFSVGLVDAFWNLTRPDAMPMAVRVFPPVLVGLVGGIVGACPQLLIGFVPALELVWIIL